MQCQQESRNVLTAPSHAVQIEFEDPASPTVNAMTIQPVRSFKTGQASRMTRTETTPGRTVVQNAGSA
jgi:hypothetical protein